jgi:hypothetical protein
MIETTGEIKPTPRPFEENAYKYADKQAELYRGLKEPSGGYANIVDAYIAGATKETAELERVYRICENNADTYYDKLQKAKRIIQEFLELNYSEFIKTNAVFLHADKFLKE